MATKAQSKAALKKAIAAPRLKVGSFCWFTNPKDGSTHEGIYRGKRFVDETTGFHRETAKTASGEERTTGYVEDVTTWNVPGSVVIHVGPKPQ